MVTFFDVDNTSDQTYNADPIVKALTYGGVTRFNTEFVTLSEEDVNSLVYEDANNQIVSLPLMKRRLVITFIAYVHECSRKRSPRGLINPATLHKGQFDLYRASEFDPKIGIVPFNLDLPQAASTSDKEIEGWKRTIKPTATSYKEFRDEAFWPRAKERFETTIRSQGLYHCIDSTHVVTNRDLDELQRGWLYKVFQDTMICAPARDIVTAHIQDKDTRAIWTEICEHFKTSMAGELRAQNTSTYLTSTRLHLMNWRGTQANFILHYKEQARQHSDMSDSPYTDKQKISFLNAAVSGVPNLATVYQLHMSSRKAAGNTTPLTFNEYCALLLTQAEVYDAGNSNKKNPSVRREVNTHELIFEDNVVGTYDVQEDLEANVHEFDQDTPIDTIMAYQTETASRFRGPPGRSNTQRVMISSDAWKALEDEDRQKWSRISEKGKGIIVNSIKNNSNNSNGFPNRSRLPPRSANVHQIETYESSPGDMTGTSDHTPTELEVSTHQISSEKSPYAGNGHNIKTIQRTVPPVNNGRKNASAQPRQQNLALLATQRNATSDGIDINKMLSQPSNNKSNLERPTFKANFTEVYMPRSEFTPEVNVHETIVREQGSSPQDSPADGQADSNMESSRGFDDLYAGASIQDDPFGLYAHPEQQQSDDATTVDPDTPLIDLQTEVDLGLDVSALTIYDSSSSSPENQDTNTSTPDASSTQPTSAFLFQAEAQDDPFGLNIQDEPKGETMKGLFSHVEKPPKFKDRIIPTADGSRLHVSPKENPTTLDMWDSPFGPVIQEAAETNQDILSKYQTSTTDARPNPIMNTTIKDRDLPDPDSVREGYLYSHETIEEEDEEDIYDTEESKHDPDDTYHEDSTIQDSVTDTANSANESYADKVKKLRFNLDEQANTFPLEQLGQSHVGNDDDGFLPVESKNTRRALARQVMQQETQTASAPNNSKKRKKKKKKKESISAEFCNLISPRGYIQESSSSESSSTDTDPKVSHKEPDFQKGKV